MLYFVIIILDLTFVASKFPARGRPRQWQWRLSIVAFHQDERLLLRAGARNMRFAQAFTRPVAVLSGFCRTAACKPILDKKGGESTELSLHLCKENCQFDRILSKRQKRPAPSLAVPAAFSVRDDMCGLVPIAIRVVRNSSRCAVRFNRVRPETVETAARRARFHCSATKPAVLWWELVSPKFWAWGASSPFRRTGSSHIVEADKEGPHSPPCITMPRPSSS